MKGNKPFFYRIDISALFDFATEPEGMQMTLLQFCKELQRGESDIIYIQSLIDEAKGFIAKKAAAGKKGMENRWLNKITNDNTDITNDNTPVTRSSNRSSNSNNKEKSLKEYVEKTREARFIPPSIEEVKAYCEERGNTINAQHWHDHYRSNGWKVGSNKMKDWQAAVRTWEQKQKGYSNGQSRTSGGSAQTGKKTGIVEANGAGTDFLS